MSFLFSYAFCYCRLWQPHYQLSIHGCYTAAVCRYDRCHVSLVRNWLSAYHILLLQNHSVTKQVETTSHISDYKWSDASCGKPHWNYLVSLASQLKQLARFLWLDFKVVTCWIRRWEFHELTLTESVLTQAIDSLRLYATQTRTKRLWHASSSISSMSLYFSSFDGCNILTAPEYLRIVCTIMSLAN